MSASAKKSSSPVPAEKSALYDLLLATFPEIERKGATTPYTSLNGNMVSFLAPDGTLALRLAKDDRQAFLDKYETTLMEQHGTVLKEYVRVPEAVFEDTAELAPSLKLSYAYVQTLKAKPTTRKTT